MATEKAVSVISELKTGGSPKFETSQGLKKNDVAKLAGCFPCLHEAPWFDPGHIVNLVWWGPMAAIPVLLRGGTER